jgi:hypothetical protein
MLFLNTIYKYIVFHIIYYMLGIIYHQNILIDLFKHYDLLSISKINNSFQ